MSVFSRRNEDETAAETLTNTSPAAGVAAAALLAVILFTYLVRGKKWMIGLEAIGSVLYKLRH